MGGDAGTQDLDLAQALHLDGGPWFKGATRAWVRSSVMLLAWGCSTGEVWTGGELGSHFTNAHELLIDCRLKLVERPSSMLSRCRSEISIHKCMFLWVTCFWHLKKKK